MNSSKVSNRESPTSENEVMKLFFVRLQKIIYKQMKIIGAVRVIKGQDVLPDGSTLDEHEIIDGSTVNIVIEPDKEINLKMKLGPKEFTQKVSSSVRVRDFKQQLIDGGIVGFMLGQCTLVITADDNDDVNDEIPLDDNSLPLHLCGVSDNTTLKIVSRKMMIQLFSQRGQHMYKTFPRNMTVNQMKKNILLEQGQGVPWPSRSLPPGPTIEISLFRECGSNYRKLDGDGPIGDVLSDYDTVHFIEDKFFDEGWTIPVLFNDTEIGRVGTNQRDTVLSVKLRVQEQMGFPVASVTFSDPEDKIIQYSASCYHVTVS